MDEGKGEGLILLVCVVFRRIARMRCSGASRTTRRPSPHLLQHAAHRVACHRALLHQSAELLDRPEGGLAGRLTVIVVEWDHESTHSARILHLCFTRLQQRHCCTLHSKGTDTETSES